MPLKLKRVKQCEKCPWKVSTNPNDIPHGYCEVKHRNLASTIADETGNLAIAINKQAIRNMACHKHPIGQEAHCVGWLMNQLGPGNNIPLRMAMRDCANIGDVILDGDQHERFEDTLPI